MEQPQPADISAELAALAAETSRGDSPAQKAHTTTPAELARLATTIDAPGGAEQETSQVEVDRVAQEAETKLQEIGIAHLQKLIREMNLKSERTANRAFRLLTEGLQRLESEGRVVRLGFGYYCSPEHYEQYSDDLTDELLAVIEDDREYEEYQLYTGIYDERLDDAVNNARNAQLVLTLHKLTSDDGPIQRRKIRRNKKRITLYSRAPERELPDTDAEQQVESPTTTIDGKKVPIGGGPPVIDLPASMPKFGQGEKLPGRVSDMNRRTNRKGGQHA